MDGERGEAPDELNYAVPRRQERQQLVVAASRRVGGLLVLVVEEPDGERKGLLAL